MLDFFCTAQILSLSNMSRLDYEDNMTEFAKFKKQNEQQAKEMRTYVSKPKILLKQSENLKKVFADEASWRIK